MNAPFHFTHTGICQILLFYTCTQIVPKEANDMMDVGRLQRFEGKITAQGNLLLHGPLLCTESGNNAERNSNSSMAIKPRELQVFLFQQSIIFSEIVGKRTQFVNPSYIYKNHIQVNIPPAFTGVTTNMTVCVLC